MRCLISLMLFSMRLNAVEPPVAVATIPLPAPAAKVEAIYEVTHVLGLSPDCKTAFALVASDLVHWDMATNTESGRWKNAPGTFTREEWQYASRLLAEDGQHLVVNGENQFEVWSLATRKRVCLCLIPGERVVRLHVATDGKTALAECRVGDHAVGVRCWDLTTGRERWHHLGGQFTVADASADLQDIMLVQGSYESQFRWLDGATGAERSKAVIEDGPFCKPSWSSGSLPTCRVAHPLANGEQILYPGAENWHVVDRKTGKNVRSFPHNRQQVYTWIMCPKGDVFVAYHSGGDDMARVCSTEDGRELAAIPIGPYGFRKLVVAPDGSKLFFIPYTLHSAYLTASVEPLPITVFSLPKGTLEKTVGPFGKILQAAEAPKPDHSFRMGVFRNDREFLVADQAGRLRSVTLTEPRRAAWDVAIPGTEPVVQLHVSPSRNTLALGRGEDDNYRNVSERLQIHLVDLTSRGKSWRSLEAISNVQQIFFTDDSKYLLIDAVGLENQPIVIGFDVATGNRLFLQKAPAAEGGLICDQDGTILWCGVGRNEVPRGIWIVDPVKGQFAKVEILWRGLAEPGNLQSPDLRVHIGNPERNQSRPYIQSYVAGHLISLNPDPRRGHDDNFSPDSRYYVNEDTDYICDPFFERLVKNPIPNAKPIGFSPTGRLLAQRMNGNVVIHEVAALIPPFKGPALTEKQAIAHWRKLGDNKSMPALVGSPESAILAATKAVLPVKPLDLKAIEKQLKELNHDNPDRRLAAFNALYKYDHRLHAVLRKFVDGKPPSEAKRLAEKQIEMLRGASREGDLFGINAVTVLERIGPAALPHLRVLATGDPEATLTREAGYAIRRLEALGTEAVK